MSGEAEKDTIIENMFYNKAGYGSVLATYKDARLKDDAITMKFVQGWFAGHVINRKQPAGRNSFVAPGLDMSIKLICFTFLTTSITWNTGVCVY